MIEIERYECIKQDFFKYLTVGKIYKIKSKRYVVSDKDDSIILFSIPTYILNILFKKVGENR